MFELLQVQNFSLNWWFWLFGLNLPKKGTSDLKQKDRTFVCVQMIVTYYIKLFRTGAERHNGILMFLLLLIAETITLEHLANILYDSFFETLVSLLHCRCRNHVKYWLLSKRLFLRKQEHDGWKNWQGNNKLLLNRMD